MLQLTDSELLRDLAAPERDLRTIPQEVIGGLGGEAWYLHSGHAGRLFFRDTQNVVAKLRTYASGYAPDLVRQELRRRLTEAFQPRLGDCYQKLMVLPPLDEIDLRNDQVTLVVLRPGDAGGLPPAVSEFWLPQEHKNRAAFLSGDRDVNRMLEDLAAQSKAIDAILDELTREVPETDPQRQEAVRQQESLAIRLRSAVREGYTALFYPSTAEDRRGQRSSQLRRADLSLEFDKNEWNGEGTIRKTLKEKGKFADETAGDIFRTKVEQRLFTQKEMQWSLVKHRAGTLCEWPWHRIDALERAKAEAIERGHWRQNGDWVEKGPFPPPRTEVRVRRVARDEETGAATLQIEAVNGDAVYWEIGGVATPSSARLDTLRGFITDELELSFLCVDSTGRHETGPPVTWRNAISLRAAITRLGRDRARVELRAAPERGVRIRYTTDGSDPGTAGGVYDGPFEVRSPTNLVLCLAGRGPIQSDKVAFPISWQGEVDVDPRRPALWKRRHHLRGTSAAYEFLGRLKRFRARAGGFGVTVTIGEGSGQRWGETHLAAGVELEAQSCDGAVASLRPLVGTDEAVIDLACEHVRFESGQDLLDWLVDASVELVPGEVEQ
jgi:hypothetical protein